MNLKTGDPSHGACGCTDFGWKVRKGGQIVARHRRFIRELRSGELHAVARVTREADRDVIHLCGRLGIGAHVKLPLSRDSGGWSPYLTFFTLRRSPGSPIGFCSWVQLNGSPGGMCVDTLLSSLVLFEKNFPGKSAQLYPRMGNAKAPQVGLNRFYCPKISAVPPST